MAAEQPGPHLPARRAAFPFAGGRPVGVQLVDQPNLNSPKDIVERLVKTFGADAVRSALPKGRGGRPKGSTTFKDLRAVLLVTEALMTGQASSAREASRMFAHLTDGNSEAAIVDRLRTKYRKRREDLEHLIRLLWEVEESRKHAVETVRASMQELEKVMTEEQQAARERLRRLRGLWEKNPG